MCRLATVHRPIQHRPTPLFTEEDKIAPRDFMTQYAVRKVLDMQLLEESSIRRWATILGTYHLTERSAQYTRFAFE